MVALICVLLMLCLMLLGLPVVYSLGFSSVLVALFAYGPQSLEKLGWTTFGTLFNINWTPLPLFVFMASLIAETRIGEDIYRAAKNFLSRVPGSLIATSIWGEALVGSMVGTSAAAILTIGKIADQEFQRNKYNRAFALGGLCCGGTLGPLIPPSAGMIIYGVLSETSIGHLFIAGILPGIILACLLSLAAILICVRRPEYGSPVGSVSWSERFRSVKRIWPVSIIVFSIVGTIYFGVATPTEAAGIGCVVLLIVALLLYKLTWRSLWRAIMETALLNGMILFMMVGAWTFSYVIGTSGIAKTVAHFVENAHISPWLIVVAINILLLILGCFVDGLTILLLTVPLFVPIVARLGFDPVWFGVVYVVNIEIGLITPPMGLNLFLVRSTFDVPMDELLRGVLPFLVVLIIFLGMVIAFPQLCLWLPQMMRK